MKIKNFFKKYKWWIITGILLLIIPIIVLVIMHKLDYINNSDNAEIIGGCLGYYGTVILGIVAVIQTQVSLKQNAETFISEKYALIKIKPECSFQLLKNTELYYKNIHNFPVNQYYVGLDNNFDFNKNLNLLKLKLLYYTDNAPINKMNLKAINFNYQNDFYVDNLINTSLCENLKENCGQIEIIFRLSKTNLKELEKSINKGTFILIFKFEIISGFNVVMYEDIEINLSDLEIGDIPMRFSKEERDWTIETTSYTYSKGDN